jgi:hypothetical protein
MIKRGFSRMHIRNIDVFHLVGERVHFSIPLAPDRGENGLQIVATEVRDNMLLVSGVFHPLKKTATKIDGSNSPSRSNGDLC